MSTKEGVDAGAREFKADTHRARNIDYWYCGSPSIMPVAASDDGVHTRLTFAAQAEQPAIVILNEDGSGSHLNFSLDEGDVILHRVARCFIVRRGSLAGCDHTARSGAARGAGGGEKTMPRER